MTLLSAQDDDDANDDDDVSSSSEDEGVELDDESDDDDDDDEETPEKSKFLHQLASSLVQELKYSHKVPSVTARLPNHQRTLRNSHTVSQMQFMEVSQEASLSEAPRSSKYFVNDYRNRSVDYKSMQLYGGSKVEMNVSLSPSKFRGDPRYRDEGTTVSAGDPIVSGSWIVGWDACAAEAIRYLVEDEGLSPHHPTVLAMKNHLEIQRERAASQYAM